jgi:phage gp29-like protein
MSRKRIENKQAAVISRDRITSYLRQRYNPLVNLTPEALRNQHAQFDAGYLRQFAMTAEHIHEKDDMVKPVAGKREKAPAIRGWEIMTVDDSAEADRHAEVLTNFYNQLTTVNAADENERGGVNLLLRQMMLAVGYKYAVHEINWLPSGEGISAEFRYVPLWFFENTTGRLRLLQDDGSIQGVPLDEGSWLITVGDGLMKATSIAYMYKHLPLRDWLVYSAKHGMPGVAGKTSAAPDSPEWKKMEAAVADFAAEFAAVMSATDTIEAIDLTAKGELPWPKLVERMDRSISILWRGSDLGTMASQSAQGTGASLQGEEMAIHDAADAAMLSEALNFYVDQWALWYHLGATKPLAYIQIKTSLKKDITADITLDQHLYEMGFPLDLQSMSDRYNRTLPNDESMTLKKPAPSLPFGGMNERARPQPATSGGMPDLDVFLATARLHLAEGVSADLQPMAESLAQLLAATEGDDEATFRAKLAAWRDNDLPMIAAQVLADPAAAGKLAEIMNAAFALGVEQESEVMT